jgi:hypothetical protein
MATALVGSAVLVGVVALAACSGVSQKLTGGVTTTTNFVVTTDSRDVTTTTAPASSPATFFFVRGSSLGVSRRVVETDFQKLATLQDLFAGPEKSEMAAGLSTAIPSGSGIEGLTVVNGVAYLDVNSTFFSPGSQNAMYLRLAQVVYTLTESADTRAVQFDVHKQPISSFAGVALNKPVTRSSFSNAVGAVLLEAPVVGDTVSTSGELSGQFGFSGTATVQILDASGTSLFEQQIGAEVGQSFDQSYSLSTSVPGTLTLKLFANTGPGGANQLLATYPLAQS